MRRNKYHNRKIVVDGSVFDSRKEYDRYCELFLLERAGKIQGLRRQVKFQLIPPQREPDIVGKRGGIKKGKLLEREVSYLADFVYLQDGEQVVEDVKGMRTTEYILKRKLMLWIHGIRIREI